MPGVLVQGNQQCTAPVQRLYADSGHREIALLLASSFQGEESGEYMTVKMK